MICMNDRECFERGWCEFLSENVKQVIFPDEIVLKSV